MEDISEFLSSRTFTRKLLKSIPCALLVFNQNGTVLDVNNAFTKLFGSGTDKISSNGHLGSILSCLNAHENPEGCGSEEYCRKCQVRKLAINSIKKNKPLESTTEYQIVHNDQVKDTLLALSASPYEYKGKRFCLLTIVNLKSDETNHVADTSVGFHGIIGRNERMLDLFDTIKQIRSSNDPVFLQGESGTGKELVAMAIHRESTRANRNFVPVNCGALPEGLLESEMFGHIKGAFTGATYNKKGRFKIADQGTIFLDEVSEMSPSMQVKFLRAIETGTYEPVGNDQAVTVNVRVISATNTLLDKEIDKGRFRSDLYYRLCVIPILIPPLRDRRDDISLLANHYLDKFSRNSHHSKMEFSKEAISIIEKYDWPGNVRELQNILKYAVLKCKRSRITPEHFPYYLFKNKIHHVVGRRRKHKLELTAVADALRKTNGNKRWAAELLGVSRSTLYRYFDRQKPRAKESP